MIRRASFPLLIAVATLVPGLLGAQDAPVPDSIAVFGNRRISRETIILNAGFTVGKPLSYRGVAQAIRELFATGHFDDVRVEFQTVDGRNVLVVRVDERPLLTRWMLKGVERLNERQVRDVGLLLEGRPLDPAVLERARVRVDSLYHARGYAQAHVDVQHRYESDSSLVTIVFDVHEGRRVAIAELRFEGNSQFSDEELAGVVKSKPEGFFWFRSGEYEDEQLREDLTARLPEFYGRHGYIDFQVLDDTLVVDSQTGKAALVVRVNEGGPYRVGSFEIIGNRRFTTEELDVLFPFGGTRSGGFLGFGGGGPDSVQVFDQARWEAATQEARSWYYNNGYIYAQVRGDVLRRVDLNGNAMVDLRWVIQEGHPAIVNRVEVVGNDVTHERVIRDAIVILPGDVFRQDALLRSYQNIANLGFFEQMPPPDTRTANDAGDVDIIFTVTEKRTGNINFGASLGQGTGIGGFIGLEEPNLFGLGKRGRLQWQFGKNINDFVLSYTDPALMGSRVSSTLSVHNSQLHYRIGDLGRVRRRGGSLQFGFPVFNDRYTRLFLSYALDEQTYAGSAANVNFRARFGCSDCVRSTVGVSVLRDTRIDLPFATGGSMTQIGTSHSGGPIGGTGNFQRVDLEGRWYAPLGEVGGGPTSRGVRFTLAFSARSGFVFGTSPFFEQLFAMGGTQYGIPLRGYEEFSITPRGFDATAVTGQATGPESFGNAFFAMTGELGARISQAFYVSAFVDAGNLWERPSEFNPTRLFRGAGVGAALISPLGPIGIDYALGFDRVDIFGRNKPAWKLHFKLGNFF